MTACFLPAPHHMHPILKQMHVSTGLINTEAGDAGSCRVVYQQCKLERMAFDVTTVSIHSHVSQTIYQKQSVSSSQKKGSKSVPLLPLLPLSLAAPPPQAGQAAPAR